MVFVLLHVVSARADITVSPFYSPSVYVDDNRRLRVEDPDGLFATSHDARLDAVYARPEYSISVAPRLRIVRNSSQRELDAEDYFFRVGAQRQFERHQLALGFGYSRALSATTELDELGVIDSAVPRTEYELNGSWTAAVFDRMTLVGFGGIADISYDRARNTSLVDYRNSFMGINIDYRMTPQTELLGRSSVGSFVRPANTIFGEGTSETTSYTAQVGFRHAFDEQLNAEFLIGQNISRSTTRQFQQSLISIFPVTFGLQRVTQTDRGSGEVVSTRVNKIFERDEVTVEWSRSINPSSLGSRQKRQEVTATISHDFNSRLIGGLVARYAQQEQESTAGLNTASRALDRVRANLSLTYRYSPVVSARVDYLYTWLDRVGAAAKAESHRVTLSLVYSGNPLIYLQ